jgi:hypothetical protein
MNVLEKVRSLHASLAKPGLSPARASEDWALAGRLLSRLSNNSARIDALVQSKDLAALALLLDELEGKVAAAAAAPIPTFPPEELDRALHAFLKRLKVSRLADESRLGGRYTSGGRKSGIDAMQPPDDFDPAIWPALVRAGKLRDQGDGFYADATTR